MFDEILNSSIEWEAVKPSYSYSEKVGNVDRDYELEPVLGGTYRLTITKSRGLRVIGNISNFDGTLLECVKKAEADLCAARKI